MDLVSIEGEPIERTWYYISDTIYPHFKIPSQIAVDLFGLRKE